MTSRSRNALPSSIAASPRPPPSPRSGPRSGRAHQGYRAGHDPRGRRVGRRRHADDPATRASRSRRSAAEAAPASPPRTGADGRTIARVFPSTLMESSCSRGSTPTCGSRTRQAGDAGVDLPRAPGSRSPDARVCLVLGGGNVSSIPAMDALYKLFVEDELVLLKMNPVNEALGPRDRGSARLRSSTADGSRLSTAAPRSGRTPPPSKVGTLHVTGSNRTYDAIVGVVRRPTSARRGGAPDACERQAALSAELGAASHRSSSCRDRGPTRTSAFKLATSPRW